MSDKIGDHVGNRFLNMKLLSATSGINPWLMPGANSEFVRPSTRWANELLLENCHEKPIPADRP
jgi:hypothetical protein